LNGGYTNAHKTIVKYICPTHGHKEVKYHQFVNNGTRCPDCYKDKQKEIGNLYGYYLERVEEQDHLYIMNFNDEYIKVGRSFDVQHRLTQLKNESGVFNISIIGVYAARHKEIYSLEQSIHEDLRRNGFGYTPVTWKSTETFCMESICSLQKSIAKSIIDGYIVPV
jgi:hypothetical protein